MTGAFFSSPGQGTWASCEKTTIRSWPSGVLVAIGALSAPPCEREATTRRSGRVPRKRLASCVGRGGSNTHSHAGSARRPAMRRRPRRQRCDRENIAYCQRTEARLTSSVRWSSARA